jgi:hypothetical protein
MCQLGDGQDTLASVSLDLLLLYPAQEADVVLLHCLRVTPLAKLADVAMVVEAQSRR